MLHSYQTLLKNSKNQIKSDSLKSIDHPDIESVRDSIPDESDKEDNSALYVVDMTKFDI